MKCHIEILATVENWNSVFKFLHKFISKITVDGKLKSEILISAEEIFVNVAKYAYPNSCGKIYVCAEFDFQREILCLKFKDQGIPFDPTKNPRPNISKNLKERKIGGLGIFMVKKMVDDMKYCYKNGSNHLLITKKIKLFRRNKNGS